jgi:hypothetical protein
MLEDLDQRPTERRIMETRIDGVADRIYRLSTFEPAIAPPAGLTFHQFPGAR